MPLSAPMDAELHKPAVYAPCCLQWDLPDGPLRLTNGGFCTFMVDGEAALFVERDDTYGALALMGSIADGVQEDAPTTSFVIVPPDITGLVALVAPQVQGSRVRIWNATLDPITNAVIGTPELWMRGPSDDAALNLNDDGTLTLTVTVQSALARARKANEAARLNNGFHQKCRPGELGFQYMQSVSRNIPWGNDTPTAGLTAAQAAAYSRLYGSIYYGA